MDTVIDINFDFRRDTPPNKDPDKYSKTLKKYHRKLWSKPLPDGSEFTLEEKGYLYHRSKLGEFYLGSDAITHSYKNIKRLLTITAKVPEVVENLFIQGNKIAAYTLFPSKQVNSKFTINQARGINAKIGDRFDLTLECIRLFYEGKDSPLTDTFNRYESFFSLFADFKGYVEFFLFQDLVSENFSSVRFHLPFDGFSGSPFPNNVDEYLEYAKNTDIFLKARRQRIIDFIELGDQYMEEIKFEVGKRYTNSKGEFVVVSISGPNMVIKWDDGEILDTTIAEQSRFVRGLEREKERERQVRKKPGNKKKTPPKVKPVINIPGLKEADLKNGKIPDKNIFVKVLSAIEKQLPKSYIELLREHYRASEHKITAPELAKKVGYKNYNAANLHYGKLAQMIMDQLRVTRTEGVNVGFLVDFIMPGEQGNKEIIWVLRPEVVSALKELNWT